MKTRTTKKLPADISPILFEEAMAKYAEAEQREAEINKRIAAEVADLHHQYAEELALISQGKQKAFEIAQSFCLQNKTTLFKSRRSIGTLHGTAGFRLGTPRLKTAKETDWKQVLAALKEQLPEYVRTTEEPARDLLLAHRHRETVAPFLMQAGVHIVQDELFYIDTGRTAAAAEEKPVKQPAQPLTTPNTTLHITKKAA